MIEATTTRVERAFAASGLALAILAGAGCSSGGGGRVNNGGSAPADGQPSPQRNDDASSSAAPRDNGGAGDTSDAEFAADSSETPETGSAEDSGTTSDAEATADSGGKSEAGSAGDSGGADASADGPAYVCQNDPAIVAYQPGLQKMGQSGQIQFVLVSAQPAPPTQGIDTFVLRLADAGGSPIVGAIFTTIKLYMPYMHHGSSAVPTVAANSDGTYTIGRIDLIMGGVWQFTFTAQSGSLKDTAVYTFCVP